MRIDGFNPAAVSGPTNPFHVARAYGVDETQPARPSAAAPAVDRAGEPPRAGRLPTISRLVAGVTPGSIDFDTQQPTAGGAEEMRGMDALPMYRHPAERNAAATAVSVGRKIDVSG